MLLLIAGNSLVGVLTPLRAQLGGFADLTIGLLGSAYFAGMLAGALATPAIVRRAGHIRAFSAFVAVGIVAVVLMPGWESPAPWMLCRGALGFVFAGIYAVIESWINAKADNASRGALYGVYQIVSFRRLGGRPTAAARFRAGFLPALQRRRRAAGARHRADGDDQRRPARPAEIDPPQAAVARPPGPGLGAGALIAGVANGAAVRARARSTRCRSASSRSRCRCSPRRSSPARRSASIRRGAFPTTWTGGW